MSWKLPVGLVCVVIATAFAVLAATSYGYAMAYALGGLIFACLGLGLVCEATDPRRKPNPRTARDG